MPSQTTLGPLFVVLSVLGCAKTEAAPEPPRATATSTTKTAEVSMTAPAIRRLMWAMQKVMDEEYADSFYELLLTTQVLVPTRDGKAVFMTGPNGQVALPIFLDEPALAKWANPPAQGAPMTAQRAAQYALQAKDAWLVVDPGSSPGGQPVAQKGVDLLAKGTYPMAERNAAKHAFVTALAAAVAKGVLDPALREQAKTLRFVVIGSAFPPDAPTNTVLPATNTEMLSVRGPDGNSYVAAWPTAAGAFAYQPDAPERTVMPLQWIIETAIHHHSGLAIGVPRPQVQLPAAQLAALWGKG